MRRARAPIRMKTSGLISWWMNVRGSLGGAIPQRPRRDLFRVRVVLPDPEDVHLRGGALRIRRDRLDYPMPLHLRRSVDVPVEELPIEGGEVLRVIPVDLEM